MNHDILAETRDTTAPENLIIIVNEGGVRIEMTRTNHLQLEQEMDRMFDCPLDQLMEQISQECQELGQR